MIRKTAAITAASIAGVVLAGGAAVGANIGILNAADDSSLGELSAQAPITAPYIEPSASVTPLVEVADSTDSTQSFTVDTAGTVELRTDENGLTLHAVRTNQGWSWEETSTDSGAVAITFTSGADTLEFTATPNADDTISASVDRPIITPASAQPQATSSSSAAYNDDDDEYEYDDDDDDDDDDEYDEYEGRDDDD
jgi:hypothetical protein